MFSTREGGLHTAGPVVVAGVALLLILGHGHVGVILGQEGRSFALGHQGGVGLASDLELGGKHFVQLLLKPYVRASVDRPQSATQPKGVRACACAFVYRMP